MKPRVTCDTQSGSSPHWAALFHGCNTDGFCRRSRVEQIKRFAVLGEDLSHEAGELTPTLKVRRNVVYERYADILDDLYR